MSDEQSATDEGQVARDALDRRAMLKRLGLGVAAAGVWVAPQVIGASPASAGCTPVLRRFQVDPGSCSSVTPDSGACTPANWGSATSASISFSCSSSDLSLGGTVTVSSAGCTPVSAQAAMVCAGQSGGTTQCVAGTIVGNAVTFPTIPAPNLDGCEYVDFRIVVSCCT